VTSNVLPASVSWPAHWGSAPLWALFDRVKDVGHPDEEMLSVYREHGVVRKSSRDDNINQTAEDRNIYQLIDEGWLVVNRMKAWQGSVGISPLRGIVSGHYLCFRPKHGEDPRFLNWLLRSDVYALEYARMSRGVRPGQIEIDNDELRGLHIALPPREEQQRIASLLDGETGRIGELERLRRQQRALLEMHCRNAISEILTPGITSDCDRYPSWPWLPASIPTCRLGYVARIHTGVTVHSGREGKEDETEYPYLRVANVQGGEVDLSEIKKITISPSIARRSMLLSGDVVMTEANGSPDNLGRGAVWRGEIAEMIHQNHVFAIRTEPSKLLSEYLSMLLASVHGRWYFSSTSTQVGIATTSSSKVLDFPVPILPLNEQTAAVDHCQKVTCSTRDATYTLDRQLALLAERKQALITAAVTGHFDNTTVRASFPVGGAIA
jgi:type I restriction enzyme, S subunit